MLHFTQNLLCLTQAVSHLLLSCLLAFGKHLIVIILIIPLNSKFIVQFMILFYFLKVSESSTVSVMKWIRTVLNG